MFKWFATGTAAVFGIGMIADSAVEYSVVKENYECVLEVHQSIGIKNEFDLDRVITYCTK